MRTTSAPSTTTTRAATTLHVRGMTCRSCEVRLRRALRAVPGVDRVDASAATGRVVVHARGPVAPDAEAVRSAVEGAGYALGREPWLARDRAVWRDVAVAAAVVLALVAVGAAAGVEEAAARVGGAALGGSLVLVVLLGVAAGMSTCMALVGGMVLAVSARHAQTATGPSSGWQRLRPHVAFNAGRVLGFGVLGAVLGAVGSAVRLSGGTVALLTVVVSLAMVAVGLQLTAVSPRLSGLAPRLPGGLAARLRLTERAAGRYADGRAAALGAASFLLPCGFTQTVQLYALASGSAPRAGAVMALFALGTAPGLLGIGGLTAAGRSAPRFLRTAGVAVLAFAALNLSGALTVLAPAAPSHAAVPAAASVSDGVTVLEDHQVLRTTQVAGGYEPATATVLAGLPVRWEVDSVAPSCASALYAPRLGAGDAPVLLPPGVTVLELPALEPGRYVYSCAMGMYTGVVDVVAR